MRNASIKASWPTYAVALTALSISSVINARADHFDEIANSPMSGGRPTAEAAQALKDELLFQSQKVRTKHANDGRSRNFAPVHPGSEQSYVYADLAIFYPQIELLG